MSWRTALNLAGICFILAVVIPFASPAGGWIASVICVIVGLGFLGIGAKSRSTDAGSGR